MQGIDAYRALPGSKAKPGSSERTVAAKLLAKVGERVAELKAASATDTTLTMRERREFIARLIRTPISDIDEHDPLCQSVKYIESERGSSREYRIADKVAAIMDDAKLAGELIERSETKLDTRKLIPKADRPALLAAALLRRAQAGN